MNTQSQAVVEDLDVVRFAGTRADGASEIIANKRFVDSIVQRLSHDMVPAREETQNDGSAPYAVVVTSSFADSRRVKESLRAWMLENRVGDLASLRR